MDVTDYLQSDMYMKQHQHPTMLYVHVHVHENSKGLSSATNPKPKGYHPIACSGKPSPSKRQSHLVSTQGIVTV